MIAELKEMGIELMVSLKPHGQLIVTADDGLEFSRLHLQRTARIGKHVLAITHILSV